MSPEIAIIETNTLAALGLRIILEELIPEATIRVFSSFEALVDDTPDMYAHYFVSAAIYSQHIGFFLRKHPRSIILTCGEQTILNGVFTLNTALPQDELIKAIMKLRHSGHPQKAGKNSTTTDANNGLTPRESEVLILLTRGLTNKEIAEKMGIALTTVISHRKNITVKLGIKSLAGLAIYTVMNGYVEADTL